MALHAHVNLRHFKTPIAIIDKRRPKPNVAEVMNIVGEIEGRTAIIIDDIIDTGTITLAQALKDKGAKDVYACCTHQFYQVLLRSVSRIQLKN